MPTPQDGDTKAPPHEWEYRCDVCRRARPATDADVPRHVQDGFPRCCRLPMTPAHRDPWDVRRR